VLHGFQANSVTASSYLYKDSLVLDTRIPHCAGAHPRADNDLNLAIGRIRSSVDNCSPSAVRAASPFALGQFSLQGTDSA
jgi:hypothetical protein